MFQEITNQVNSHNPYTWQHFDALTYVSIQGLLFLTPKLLHHSLKFKPYTFIASKFRNHIINVMITWQLSHNQLHVACCQFKYVQIIQIVIPVIVKVVNTPQKMFQDGMWLLWIHYWVLYVPPIPNLLEEQPRQGIFATPVPPRWPKFGLVRLASGSRWDLDYYLDLTSEGKSGRSGTGIVISLHQICWRILLPITWINGLHNSLWMC